MTTKMNRECVAAGLVLALLAAGCSSDRPDWADRNDRMIEQFQITGRTR